MVLQLLHHGQSENRLVSSVQEHVYPYETEKEFPLYGVVTTRTFIQEPSSALPASRGAQPILQIVDDHRLRLVVPVPEAQVGEMKIGEQVSFTGMGVIQAATDAIRSGDTVQVQATQPQSR